MGYSNRADSATAGNPHGSSFDEWMTEAGSFDSLRNHTAYITYVVDGTLGNPGGSSFIGDYAGNTSLDNNFDTFPIWTDLRTGANSARTMDLCYLDCYTSLLPYTPRFINQAAGTSFTDFYQFNTDVAFGGAGNNYWNAVGIREGADGTGADDDMSLYGDRYFSNLLTSSVDSPPYNDYLLQNDNAGFSAQQPYFPQVHSFSTLGSYYTIEWASGFVILPVGAYSDSMGSSDTVRVYDASLATGTLYYLGLRPAGGNTSNYSLTLHSASNGTTQGRGSRVADSGNVAVGQPAFISYNTGPDASQFDGVVVLNNNGGLGSYTLYLDTVAPTGSISINGGATYTNNPSVTLTLSASNTNAADPVVEMAFSTDGVNFGPWQAYAGSAPFTLPAGDSAKTAYVEYRNGAGAISTAASASITLDTVAPQTVASLSGVGPVQVTLMASDATSGVATTVYALDGGTQQTYSGPFLVSAPGNHTVIFHSVDNAGNVESDQSVSFSIAAPTGTSTTTPVPPTATKTPIPAASITLNPTTGHVGQTVTVSGAHYGPSEVVKIFWGSTVSTAVASVTSSPAGAFVVTFAVPQAILGGHSVIAVGQTSSKSATAPFTVAPKLAITPASGHHGSSATVAGTGYGATESVQVKFNCATSSCTGTLLGTATTNATGQFSGLHVTIPAAAPLGSHTVGAKGLTSHGFATTTFTVN